MMINHRIRMVFLLNVQRNPELQLLVLCIYIYTYYNIIIYYTHIYPLHFIKHPSGWFYTPITLCCQGCLRKDERSGSSSWDVLSFFFLGGASCYRSIFWLGVSNINCCLSMLGMIEMRWRTYFWDGLAHFRTTNQYPGCERNVEVPKPF